MSRYVIKYPSFPGMMTNVVVDNDNVSSDDDKERTFASIFNPKRTRSVRREEGKGKGKQDKSENPHHYHSAAEYWKDSPRSGLDLSKAESQYPIFSSPNSSTQKTIPK